MPYSNFVKASLSQSASIATSIPPSLSGEEARKLYLEEVREATLPRIRQIHNTRPPLNRRNVIETVSEKDLFISAETNDVNKLVMILDTDPDLLNKVDDYGWSLLMIACQANSVEVVGELLKRGADTSIRDKGGNSANTLVIKNKNLVLADLLLSYRKRDTQNSTMPDLNTAPSNNKQHTIELYNCEMCNNTYPDKAAHLSSTIHNISASKDKKIPTNYVIPQTNKGFQLMLKGGWDKETGLGRHGSGKKYPIKPVQKLDRTGLGHEEKPEHREDTKQRVKFKNKHLVNKERRHIKRLERNFRREFY